MTDGVFVFEEREATYIKSIGLARTYFLTAAAVGHDTSTALNI